MPAHRLLRFSILLRVALACPVAMSLPARAQDSSAESSETVVVTATRTEQPLAITGTSLSVISDADLVRQQIFVVSDALAEVPGVSIIRNGGMGQSTSIAMRGAAQGQTLVLIDGTPINDPSTTDDGAVLGDVMTENVARIEVLRGPQSTLYGSAAIGGVVNIVTRRGGDQPFAFDASAEGGQYDTYRLSTGAHGSAGMLDYGVAGSILHTNGISAADRRFGNSETDGYTHFGGSGNFRFNLASDASLDLRGYFTNARDFYDDGFSFSPPYRVQDSAAYNRNRLLAYYSGLNFALFDGKFANRIAINGSSGNRAFYDSIFDTVHRNFDDRGSTIRLEYQGIVSIAPGEELTFGAEHERRDFSNLSFSSYMPSTRDSGRARVTGLYAQALVTIGLENPGDLTLIAGMRRDSDSRFGGHNSYRLSAAWAPARTTNLHASYGDGFKAPSLYEEYSQYSNPVSALKPEVAGGWEAGAEQRVFNDRTTIKLTWFDRRTQDQIDFFDCFTFPAAPGCSTRPFGFYYNIGRTRARGLEAEVSFRVNDDVSTWANMTDMTARDLNLGTALARRPQVTANAGLDWRINDAASAGLVIEHVGGRFDQPANSTRLKSYTLANLTMRVRVRDDLELYGRIENALDARYEPVFGYGAAGRALYAGIRMHE